AGRRAVLADAGRRLQLGARERDLFGAADEHRTAHARHRPWRRRWPMIWRLFYLALLLAGCSSTRAPAPPPSTDSADPLAQPPPTSTLTDVDGDLDAVLEHGALAGACDRWRAGDASERLRCGKWMFFYESFGTTGVPTVLAQFLVGNFPDDIGPGFE